MTRRLRWRPALGACVALLGLIAAPGARAHGGPPVIEGVLAADDGGPFLVELSEGFALRSADSSEWSFVCPALFGAELPPPAAGDASEAWLAGGADLYRLDAARVLTAMGYPDLSGARVLALAPLDGALLALRLTEGGGTELVRVHEGALDVIFQTPVLWSALAVLPPAAGAAAQLWLARVEGEAIEVLALSPAGDELQRASEPLPITALGVRLSVAGDHVFAHAVENGGYALLHVASRGGSRPKPEIIVTAALPIRGPALRDGEILLTRDAELLTWTPGELSPSASPIGSQTLTCLTSQHACTQRALYSADAIEQAGAFEPADALLDLARLQPPRTPPVAPASQDPCSLQWLVFRADLVRAGIAIGETTMELPPDAGDAIGEMPGPPAESSARCSVRLGAPSRARALAGLLLALIAALTSRRGARRSPPPR